MTNEPQPFQPAELNLPRRRSAWATALLLIAILLAGMYFRFVGLDWDADQHLHPDERFLTMVESAIQLPQNIGQYFDSLTSPLNPYNNNFGLFVYGDLPIILTRYVAAGLDGLCQTGAAHACLDQNNSPFLYSDYGHVDLLGRVLSALFDLGTLLWLFLIARRLYDRRIALLATVLGAAAVLQIQQAHFFTVDTFATFFVAATFYFIVRLAETNSWKDTIAAGLGAGMSLASRINVAPIVGIIGLALLLAIARRSNWREHLADRVQDVFVRLIVVVIVGFIAFRLFQPYAFNGLVSFDPRFRDNMDYISQVISGDITAPPDVQWTNRTPIVFPWINMVVWGLGIPLGISAWIGWAFAGIEMLKKRRWLAHLLPWVWITGYFAWQGSQWVKSMRYLLPIYPFLIMFAAVALIAFWDWARDRRWQTADGRKSFAIARLLSAVAIATVLLGTYAWAFAFTRIYTQPTTRVAASQWIYDNLPTAATLTVEQNGAPKQIQLAFPATMQLSLDNPPVETAFKVDQDSAVDSIMIHHLIDVGGQPDADVVRMSIAATGDPGSALDRVDVTAHVETTGALGGPFTFSFKPIQLKAGQTYYAIAQLISGGPLQAESSTFANELWDDPIPLRIDGRDGFSNYHGVDIGGYDEDTPEKLGKLIGWLDKTDYIMLTSNRLYASIPRQPLRYPMMSEYYRLLFSGQLGFKLIASFESYPTLGPFTFPDQETTQAMGVWPDPSRCPQSNVPQCAGLINVPLPPAEEAFSVYDHPRVVIFQKTADFSAQAALTKLGSVPLNEALNGFTPKSETAAPNGLMLEQSTWKSQQTSGTWSDLFDRNSWLNQAPLLGAIVWYVIVAALGLFAFPIVFAAVPGLRDRAYGVSRVAGLLLVAFVIWLLASFKIVPFTRIDIALTILALAVIGGAAAWWQREALRNFWNTSRRLILIEELIFFVAFAIFLFIRFGNPDLWHPAMGGEKPMDFAYLNAVIKSQYFPPYDPWFAGGQISYYYWGFVLVATLIKLIGVIPSIAYNFAIPTLFAMTALGAFCAGFNLVISRRRSVSGDEASLAAHDSASFGFRPFSLRNPILIGIIAAVFVTFMGNLGEVQLLEEHISELGQQQTHFNSSIRPLQMIVDTAAGLGRMIFNGDQLDFRPEWWYFTPTRIIPAPTTEAGPITEFPFFTFLYADLHAHMIAMPLTLLALALAIGWLKRIPKWTWSGLGSIGLAGLVVGALRATNTWDYPTYLVIGSAALLIGTLAAESIGSLATWGRLAIRVGVFAGLSLVFFIPFSRNYATAYTSIESWTGSLTPLWAYLNVHLLFLLPIATFLLFEVKRWGWRFWQYMWRVLNDWQLPVLLLGALVIFAGVLVLFSGREVIVVVEPLVILIMLLIVRPRLAAAERFWMFLILLSIGLTLVVEVVVLKGDISRMNTVFKFYIQVWILLGIAAAVALGWLADRLEAWRGWGGSAWKGFMLLLVAGSFLYVPLAVRAKMLDRFVTTMPPSLNGTDYMTQAVYNETGQDFALNPDHDLITWMQDHIVGTPVIAEGQSPLYHWGARISINTGLPSIIGWDWHQRQQRSIMPGAVIDERLSDVQLLYQTTDATTALRILKTYNVQYVVVGAEERSYYPPGGLAKFDQMVTAGTLRIAYQNDGDKLYQVIGDH